MSQKQNQDRVRDLAFNELTAALSMYSRYVPLREREVIVDRILAIVVPEVQAQAAEAAIDRTMDPARRFAAFWQGIRSASSTASGGGL